MRLVLFALLSLLLLYAGQASAEKRVALIIANSHYDHVTSLDTPLADAAVIKPALVQVGFTVTFVRDGTKADIENALRAFGRAAEGADIALVYYAGHGIAIDGENYLIPVDAQLSRALDTRLEAISFNTLDAVAGNAQRRMIILDACRNNPFIAVRAVGDGLAVVEPVRGTLVILSTRAGKVAQDGDETNSPFALSFARHVVAPGLEVNSIFRRVRDDVMRDTSGKQEPVTFGSLSGDDYYLASVPAAAAVASREEGQVELYLWRGAIEANSAEAFADYLQRYPMGRFAVQARENARRLQGAASPQNAPIAFASRSPAAVSEPRAAGVPTSPSRVSPAVTAAPVVTTPANPIPAPPAAGVSTSPAPIPVSAPVPPVVMASTNPISVPSAASVSPSPISVPPAASGAMNPNYVTPEAAIATVGAHPILATLPVVTLPDHFCSAEARNAFYDTVLKPTKDLANQNNVRAIAYLETVHASYQRYREKNDAVGMTTLSRESTAYQAIAAEAFRVSTDLGLAFEKMMAVPITSCSEPARNRGDSRGRKAKRSATSPAGAASSSAAASQ